MKVYCACMLSVVLVLLEHVSSFQLRFYSLPPGRPQRDPVTALL
jgi:hypothetical protein